MLSPVDVLNPYHSYTYSLYAKEAVQYSHHSNIPCACEVVMSIRRKELPLPHKEDETLKLELLATFPHPPSSHPSARLPSQQKGVAPEAWRHGLSTNSPNDDTDIDSLYDEPGPPLSPSFSQRDPPSQSRAEFQIILNHPSKIYSPGDTISGYVIGYSMAEECVHVILAGHATTSLRDSRTIHTDQTSLIYLITNILPGAETFSRFEIRIPLSCRVATRGLGDLEPQDHPSNRWTATWPFEDTFENKDGHPLPPSMHMAPRKLSTLSVVHGEASIIYSVIAVRSSLDTSTSKLKPNATCQLPLTVTTLRLPSPKINHLRRGTCILTCNLSAQTAALSKERKLRLSEQLRDAFNTSAPIFYFKIKVTVPKIGTPGANTKVGIGFEVQSPPAGHSYTFPLPDIAITSMTFRIRSYTGVRVLVSPAPSQSTVDSPLTTSRKETFRHTEFGQVQTPKGVVFKPRDGGFEGQVCVAAIPLPQDLTPSFKTYNSWRGYRLECAIRVQVAGRQEEAKVASDLNIVAVEHEAEA